MTGGGKPPPVGGRRRALLELVHNGGVLWHPELHRAERHETTEGGYVRCVGDLVTVFGDLSDLVEVWRLAKDGLIVPSPIPSDPRDAKRPRPVHLTGPGRALLRAALDNQ